MTSAEHERRPEDAPTGLPDDVAEATPLGPTEARPEGEDEIRRGDREMPGIPDEGEPPTAG